MTIASVASYAALNASSSQFGKGGTGVAPHSFKLIRISLNLSAEILKLSTEEMIGCHDRILFTSCRGIFHPVYVHSLDGAEGELNLFLIACLEEGTAQ